MEIIGLVPCAGKGSRLGLPFSKEMFPDVHDLKYRPIIMHTIEALKSAGINDVIFTINHQKMDLLKYLGNGHQFGMQFSYCVHPEPKSLPESLEEAYHLVKGKIVAFAMPDTVIYPQDFFNHLKDFYINKKPSGVTLAGFQTNNPEKFGMVEFVDTTVVRIVDKPKNSTLNWMWGAMLWNPIFTEHLHEFVKNNKNTSQKELILSDALERMIESRMVSICAFEKGSYKDLGTYNEIVEWSEQKQKLV